MLGKIIYEQVGERQMFIYLPPQYEMSKQDFPVVYANDGKELEKLFSNIITRVEKKFEDEGKQPFILVGIYAKDRIHEYTPWPAQALSERFQDFKGEGDAYLSEISQVVIPYINCHYRVKQEAKSTAMMGYSLGGLISLYAAFSYKDFGKSISISGSFWYINMIDFVEKHTLIRDDQQIYMSYGLREGSKKPTIQAQAVNCAIRVRELLYSKLITPSLLSVHIDEGGHHDHMTERYEAALEWISGCF